MVTGNKSPTKRIFRNKLCVASQNKTKEFRKVNWNITRHLYPYKYKLNQGPINPTWDPVPGRKIHFRAPTIFL